MGTFSKEVLQASFLFREFVINLMNVYRLQQGITIGMVGMPDMYKQVFVVLQGKQNMI